MNPCAIFVPIGIAALIAFMLHRLFGNRLIEAGLTLEGRDRHPPGPTE